MSHVAWLNSVVVSEISFVNTYVATQEIYPIIKKSREHHGFLLTLRGTEVYRFPKKTIRAIPGSLLYIPKGEEYYTTLEGDISEVTVIDFETQNNDSDSPFLVPFPKDSGISSCFREAEAVWERNAGYLAFCKSYFYRIAALTIMQESNYSPVFSDKLGPSLVYMREHYLQPDFKISDLSKIAGISAKYFGILFEKRFGVSPKEYVLSLKTERAKQLLLSEKIKITEIASELGFCDVYHFSKMFKKKTGYSPRDFRNR